MIDEICDCFEHQLYTGTGPSIETLLSGFQEPERSVLLYELLLLEVEQLVNRRQTVLPEAFYRRFPRDAQVVCDVLDEYSPRQPAGTDATEEWPSIPNYKVLRRLQKGGMGDVYEAIHTKLGSLAAIKVMRQEYLRHPDAEFRFEREMRVIGTLAHPNIVAARDAGKSDGLHYLVMEYVIGSDLADLIAQHGPLKQSDACEIARRVARALEHAHQANLVHRDIKPNNILIGHTGSTAGAVQVKVADFGLALLRGIPKPSDSNTRSEIVGTLTFMAPEQFWQQTSDIRSDIYSLGCTLYFLLCGAPPFRRSRFTDTRKLMAAHRDLTPPSLGEKVDWQLQAVIDQMLAKDPKDRQQSPSEVVDAMLPFTDGYDLDRLLAQSGQSISNEPVDLPETQTGAVDPASPDDIVFESQSESIPDSNSFWTPAGTNQSDKADDSETKPWSDDVDSIIEPTDTGDRDTSDPELRHKSTPLRSRLKILALILLVSLLSCAAYLFRSAHNETIDLLSQIDPSQDALYGNWKQQPGGILVSPDEEKAIILLRADVPEAYRLEIKASRRTGGRLVVGLVCSGRQFPIELDAIAVGPQLELDHSAQDRQSQQARRLGFSGGTSNAYTCLVQPDGLVVAWEDQVLLVANKGEFETLSSSDWRTTGFAGLFIGTQASIYEFTEISLETIDL